MDTVIICPHCEAPIMIEKLNCGIFRHGVFKDNNEQIPPHLSENACLELIENKKIYGCGKPFKVNNDYSVEICGYI